MDLEIFETRKREHIEKALRSDNQAIGLSGLNRVHLFHDALPDFDFEKVSLEALFLGQPCPKPFYISGMTAGHAEANQINERLAAACHKNQWSLGIGSQRRELESDSEHFLDFWEEILERYPGLKTIGNIGISQIIGVPTSRFEKMLSRLRPRALAVHLNSLQEVIQKEGTTQFKGALNALDTLTREMKIPVVLKETGCGFSTNTLKKIVGLKLGALDVSGLGGTHWGRVEGDRASRESLQALAAQTFKNWGESTVDSLLNARKILGNRTEIWASGGVRSGLDAAKLIALGASQVGYASPALEMALKGNEKLNHWMELQEFELKIAIFCTGSESCLKLMEKPEIWKINEN